MIHNPTTWAKFKNDILTSKRSKDALFAEAELEASLSRISVVDKQILPPSGDPHDYFSIGSYWWPNPDTPNGLPYVRKDGQMNPEVDQTDSMTIQRMRNSVAWLILSAFAGGSTEHARRAGERLRCFFLDPSTRMNPHLNYAQAVPGKSDGRGFGIIDTRGLCFLLDALPHLAFNDSWKESHLHELKRWFSNYLDWLLDSKNGKFEQEQPNNHGTWFDAQVVCFARFCDRLDVADQQLKKWTLSRIASQIADDGSQPHELLRTLSFWYSNQNLVGFACMAPTARLLGFDLWNAHSTNGSSLKKAIRWMLPYYLDEKEWPGQQIYPFVRSRACYLLQIAWQETGEDEFRHACEELTNYPWDPLLFEEKNFPRRPVATMERKRAVLSAL